MGVKIRKARSNDLDQVFLLVLDLISSEDIASTKVAPYLMDLRIRRHDFKKSAKNELLKNFSEKNSLFLVAELGENVVGYIRGTVVQRTDAYFKKHKIAYLESLVVSRKYVGNGIASKLNSSLEEWFKKKGCSQIHLEVHEKNNASKIYEK